MRLLKLLCLIGNIVSVLINFETGSFGSKMAAIIFILVYVTLKVISYQRKLDTKLPEYDECRKQSSYLEIFIHNEEPAGEQAETWRQRLLNAIIEAKCQL